MHTSARAHALRTSAVTYPGRVEQVRTVRADLRAMLNGCPVADDVILCASELAANAARHSRSSWPGGHFSVRVEMRPRAHVQLTVGDQGGPWIDAAYHDDHSHGLDLVRMIAGDGNWGIRDTASGRVVWVKLKWPAVSLAGLDGSYEDQNADRMIPVPDGGRMSPNRSAVRSRAAEVEAALRDLGCLLAALRNTGTTSRPGPSAIPAAVILTDDWLLTGQLAISTCHQPGCPDLHTLSIYQGGTELLTIALSPAQDRELAQRLITRADSVTQPPERSAMTSPDHPCPRRLH